VKRLLKGQKPDPSRIYDYLLENISLSFIQL